MRIGEIEVGKDYVTDSFGNRIRVTAIVRESEWAGRDTHYVRVVEYVNIDADGKVAPHPEPKLTRKAKDIREPWDEWFEREQKKLWRERPLRIAETTIDRLLEKLDLDAEVKAGFNYGSRGKDESWFMTIEFGGSKVDELAQVLMAANLSRMVLGDMGYEELKLEEEALNTYAEEKLEKGEDGNE